MRHIKVGVALALSCILTLNALLYPLCVYADAQGSAVQSATPVDEAGSEPVEVVSSASDSDAQESNDSGSQPLDAAVNDAAPSEPQPAAIDSFSYCTHVQDLGWQSYVSSGETSGTTGKSKRVEAIKVKLSGIDSNGDSLGSDAVQVEVHVSGIGWQDGVGNDAVAGTTGQSRAVEAVKISLSSELASRYNIFYRVHSSQFGWLGWASNGDSAGSAGYSRQIEALQILLLQKDDTSAPQTGDAFKNRSDEPPVLSYSTHVSNVGWMGSVPSGQTAGMTGSSNAIEALSSSVG